MIDVSIYNLAKKALQQGEECLLEFLDALPQMAWTGSPSGKILYFNKAWYAYTGMKPAQTDGWVNVIHPDDSSEVISAWNTSLRTGDYHVEYRIRCSADKTYRWFLEQAMPLRDEEGAVIIWIGTYTDITDEKQHAAP